MDWKRASRHPVVPIVIGYLLCRMAGSVVSESLAMMAMWIWVCADVTVWLNRKHTVPMLWRQVAVYAFISASIIPVLFMMRWTLQIKLDREQADVYGNLSAQITLPAGNPFRTAFTVRNGGGSAIGAHRIGCEAVHIMGPVVTVRNSYLESSPGAVFPVLGFGDAETAECPGGYGVAAGPVFRHRAHHRL